VVDVMRRRKDLVVAAFIGSDGWVDLKRNAVGLAVPSG
jgi:hypothetical protein